MPLTKAIIEILDEDAVDPSRGLPRQITVQFNPTEYTLAKGAQIGEVAINGLDSPVLQFIRGQNEKLTLDLFFDTAGEESEGPKRDVREMTKSIYQLVKIQPATHAPPRIRFTWGKGLSFKAIVENVQQKFTLFSDDGTPLRATVSVAFREYKTLKEQLQELNLQSRDHTKRRVVQRGDTLVRIAAEEYRDAGLWRPIAEANKLSNPLALKPGMELEIPPIDVASSGTR